jgi:ACS family hexuronate transporter-like MFS transporter
MTRVRWAILALLFAATTINYLDRIVLSVLSPVLMQDLGMNKQMYGNVTAAFQLAYAFAFLIFGKLIDRYGTRFGYAVATIWWSIAGALHALARSPLDLGFYRALLGLGEAGNFPSAIKAVAEWFPKQERALATGIFNAGSNVAAMIGPPVFVWMNGRYGWRACFLITAATGFVWLIAWQLLYRLPRQHRSVNAAELQHIADGQADEAVPAMSWKQAASYKQTWGFAFAKFFTDPVWWFYLYWLPPYLFEIRKFDLTAIGWALPVIYLMADLGSVGGGWLSSWLIARGWPNGKARKLSMALCALAMPVAALSVLAPDPLLAVALVSLATAAHQGWSANLYTTTSDVFPKSAVASVTGIGSSLGGFGGFLFSGTIAGWVVTHLGYTPLFLTMGCFHLIGFAWVHFTMGKLEPVAATPRPLG